VRLGKKKRKGVNLRQQQQNNKVRYSFRVRDLALPLISRRSY
jgi:hypothetical protein